jgi:hypothetical protein
MAYDATMSKVFWAVNPKSSRQTDYILFDSRDSV